MSSDTCACICEICNCGLHHCPPTPRTQAHYDPGQLQTQYTLDYPVHKACPVHSAKPKSSTHVVNAPFQGETTNRSDYRQWGDVRSKPVPPPKGTLALDNAPFQGQTTYKSNYQGERTQPARSMKPKQSAYVPGGRFDGVTTHKADFPRHEGASPSEPFRPVNARHATGPEDRQFVTEHQNSFNPKGSASRKSFKPAQRSHASVPFVGQTTQKTDYPAHLGMHAAPINRPERRSHVGGGGDDRDFLTEQQLRYTGQRADPTKSCKPAVSTFRTNAPFDGTTTNRADFRRFENAQPSKPVLSTKQQGQGKLAPEDRDFGSEAKRAYVDHGYAKRKSARPPQREFHTAGHFDGTTTNKSDFQRWNAEPSQAFKPKMAVHATGPDDRDFSTTHTRTFNPKGDATRRSFKPKARSHQTLPDDRNFMSEKASEYGPKQSTRCPALDLIGRKQKTVSGHKMYVRPAPGSPWQPR